MLPVLLGLGTWQLDRARFKADLASAFDDAEAQRSFDVDGEWQELDADNPRFRFRTATVTGTFDGRHFLLDNRTHEGRAGYFVLTALKHKGNAPALVVNRGWRAWDGDRSSVPVLDAPAGVLDLSGRLAVPPRAGLLLGDDGFSADVWPRIIQRYDQDSIEAALGLKVLPMLLLLDTETAGGYTRQWRANPGVGPARHRGYAVQWFALALALTVIYITVNTRRDVRA